MASVLSKHQPWRGRNSHEDAVQSMASSICPLCSSPCHSVEVPSWKSVMKPSWRCGYLQYKHSNRQERICTLDHLCLSLMVIFNQDLLTSLSRINIKDNDILRRSSWGSGVSDLFSAWGVYVNISLRAMYFPWSDSSEDHKEFLLGICGGRRGWLK